MTNTPIRPAARPMPQGGQARELFRDVLTDLAVIEHQASRAFTEKHAREDEE